MHFRCTLGSVACFWCQSFGDVSPYVCSCYFSSVCVAEGNSCPHSVTQLTICFLCILTICNFFNFPFWFGGLDLGSDCFSSWSLHTFYFYQNVKMHGKLRICVNVEQNQDQDCLRLNPQSDFYTPYSYNP